MASSGTKVASGVELALAADLQAVGLLEIEIP